MEDKSGLTPVVLNAVLLLNGSQLGELHIKLVLDREAANVSERETRGEEAL